MNKGRNILLIMISLLLISVLSFFTLFERTNNSGVVDNVRYIVDSETDGVKTLNFYFVEPGVTKTCTVTESEEAFTFVIEDSEYVYYYNKSTDEVAYSPEGGDGAYPYAVYTKALFRQIVKGHDKFMKFYQAAIVAVVCALGGAIILFAEEIWLFIHRKEGREPQWKDMNTIKIIGGGTVALGIIIMILFILL